jgi:hypothetical protein
MSYKIVLGILLIFVSVVAFIALGFSQYYVHYQYEKVIGSYMDNAKDMNTPDKMLEQLNLARAGMLNEGLTEDMYGAWIFTKPDNSMKFQYEHLDSIIERVKAVQEWKDKTYGNSSNSQTESLGDVYEQKMDNLREFIMEDTRSDWIAKDAWYVHKHFFYYFWADFIYLFLIMIVIVGIILCFADY